MENPFLKVTPAQALSRMLAVFSFEPIKIAGSTISEFVKNSIGEYLNYFKYSIVLFFT